MQAAAVYACVRVLAESIASLPLFLYETGSTEKAVGHPLFTVLHDLPNPELTSYELRELFMVHLALWGNSYSEIVRDSSGKVREIWPLNPARVTPTRSGKQIVYVYDDPTVKPLPASKVLHIRGLGFDGMQGYSIINVGKEAIGLALATEGYGARLFSQDATPKGVLNHPGKLSTAARENITNSWQETYAGLSNAHRTALLEEGLTWQSIGIPPEDAQFLQTRKYQLNEIARLFGVPPHMIGDMERATNSNIEHQSISYVRHTLTPWAKRIEQAISRDLLTSAERAQVYPRLVMEGMLRGDTQTRYNAYAVARQNGWLSANDIRRLESMPAIDGGDVYLVPLNMVPADQVADGDADAGDPTPTRRAEPDQVDAVALAVQRQKLSTTQQGPLADALGRVLRREANDIQRASKKHLQDIAGFREWLDNFYDDHEEFIVRQMGPALVAYAQLVADLVAAEIGEMAQAEAEWAAYVTAYLKRYAKRHRGKSMIALDAALEREDPEPALVNTFDQWRDERPATVARGESTRFNNALAKVAYVAAGVGALTWHTLGDSCPWCQMLNGRTIAIDTTFIAAGDELAPGGDHAPMAITGDVGHPPAHGGCDCIMLAGVLI